MKPGEKEAKWRTRPQSDLKIIVSDTQIESKEQSLNIPGTRSEPSRPDIKKKMDK